MADHGVRVTGHAQREAWRSRRLPPVERLSHGAWSIPVPFPGNPMRYTLCYVLPGNDGATVIDPGFDSSTGWAHLRAGLAAADVGLREVTGIVVTHFHTDHLGLAGRLADASGGWVALGRHERRYITAVDDVQAEEDADRRRMQAWGVPVERLPEAVLDAAGLLEMQGFRDPDVVLTEGESVPLGDTRAVVHHTPGHTPGHIVLWDHESGVAYAGDHLLPRITSNVCLEMRAPQNPLQQLIDALERTLDAPDLEVLPAHEYRFRGLAGRSRQLLAHVHARTDEVAESLAAQSDATVWSVAQHVHWSRGFEQLSGLALRLALGETAAHLQWLMVRGEVPALPGLSATANG